MIKDKMMKYLGSISGLASILGSWQVCHNVCLGLLAILSIMGITVIGMPLAFLTKIVFPVWIGAVIILSITYYYYLKKKCISGYVIAFNTGLILAGIPFFQSIQIIFWSLGGLISVSTALLYLKTRFFGGKKK